MAEAVQLLAEHPDAQPLAGGTDLLLDLARNGPGPAVTLVDLTGIAELHGVGITDNTVRLAALTTHNQVVANPRLRELALPLAQACLEVGSPQLRNRATIAGNVATASPANDTISALLVLDATVELQSVRGSRVLPLTEFLTGFRQTALEPGELITAIEFPALSPTQTGIWAKLGNRAAQAISVLHLGVVIERDADGVVTDARLALGSAAATVTRLTDAEQALLGGMLSDETIRDAGRHAQASVTPIDDVRATADYRTQLISTLITRSLQAVRDLTVASRWPTNPPCLRSDGLDPHEQSVALPARAIGDDDTITVTVNNVLTSGQQAASQTLLDWLRDEADLTAAKEGCGEGECGACTVMVDGAAVMSCLVNAAQVDGRSVTTAEGIGIDGPSPLQQAFVDEFAVQCGFCIPGFIVAGTALLNEQPHPDAAQIALGLSGNLCRCTGYYPIIDAIRVAASTGPSPQTIGSVGKS